MRESSAGHVRTRQLIRQFPRDDPDGALLLQEAGLAAGIAIGNGSALVGLLPGTDLPECLAVPSTTTGHTAPEESAQQSQREEIRVQGTEAAAGRSQPFGIASREDAHAGRRRRRFRSLHPRLLHRKYTYISD